MVSNDIELQLSFLLSGTCNVIPSSYFKLRSYLNIHLSNLAEHLNFNLPKNLKNRNKICPYCYSDWSSYTSSFKLLPSKKIKFRQTRNENGKKVNKDQLKECRNTVVLKCKVCTNKSFFSLVKKKPAKELVKEETVKLFKKKKKRKDKSCGLTVNLKKGTNCMPEIPRLKDLQQSKKADSAKHSQSNQSGSPKKNLLIMKGKSNSISGRNNKLVCNPFTLQSQGKFSNKKDKKLQSLKKAIKKEKGLSLAKKTLKDFLTLI